MKGGTEAILFRFFVLNQCFKPNVTLFLSIFALNFNGKYYQHLKKLLTILALLCSVIVYTNVYSQEEEGGKSLTDNPTSLKKYVVDETGTLTSTQINSLMTKLVNFEKTTSNQIIVYIINSLNGEPIENVAVEIARKNKIGKKDKNNGVLLLVAMKDRKMRIEVGYGLEGALTDANSRQIIDKDMKPAFKQGKYYEGIDKAVDDIILVTKGEFKPDAKGEKDYGGIFIVVVVFLAIIIFIIIGIIKKVAMGRRMITGRKGSGLGDVATGFFLGSLFSNSGSGSGWSSGSSSNSDFGGFSGGGGDFGGGGASGDW